MVAEGTLEPIKKEIAKNSQSGRCKAEEQMGGDSSNDILEMMIHVDVCKSITLFSTPYEHREASVKIKKSRKKPIILNPPYTMSCALL
jgi:hypothetical protein